MPDRAGYELVVYAIDVSPSMGEVKVDGIGERTKLDLAKEYVARRCEPKISSGRKTEAIGIVSFGGRTNNQANQAYKAQNPEDDDPPYEAVSCDVAIQTAKPKTVEELLNLELGKVEGNPVSALMVALDMVHTHKHTKSWALEVVLVTDGESAFAQDEYEELMDRFDDMGVKLTIVGIGFQDPVLPVEKDKTRNKRLSEKFWRTFFELLHKRMAPNTDSDAILPSYCVFDEALAEVRLPKPATVNGTVSGIDLHIGSASVDPAQAITIPIKYSKATMKARPPSLSKAWKAAMPTEAGPSQLARFQPSGSTFETGMISAEVKNFTSYVIRHQEKGKERERPEQNLEDDDYEPVATQELPMEEEDEEPVAKEDIVKAWRFGSTWVPMEADTFEPLDTQKGVEILGFFPRSSVKRHLLMGEVRFVWPDMSSPKAQIQFSSLVEGMSLRDMVAVVRWVLKDRADPVIGLCVPEMDYPGDDKRLDYMFWVKLPFAEDEHTFWFPSLTEYKTTSAKKVTEHPLLPTKEQCALMDDLVEGMDLDAYADKIEEGSRWFEPSRSFNPVIHRIKEAIFHASTSEEPLGPPHPELTKYFETPDEILEAVDKTMAKLQTALNIKKVPPKMRRKMEKQALRPDEGYIDIDQLFDAKPEPGVKVESQDSDVILKRGRLISNERPVEDFRRVIEGEGDVFRKAIRDLGVVIKENVAASFSRQAFPMAIECLEAMRETALVYEEVETFNDYMDELEAFIVAPGFKHQDFWDSE
ncbi:SPOC like C-terminal domain-containing protein [Kockovaella imperatae]|uniref:ATP-dependent DNA helicase II subunit 2 n=1 Tax=Kockovaella imperatae TaxID=4999 RepID=A0A1Y1UQF2_9TREE|nr:SPOC like C-terminal domain-containing protein [Kockovaella imperatae]ORX39724.1 SPOC like C-terminal domain-containing protein [Kockovaella imperatae]